MFSETHPLPVCSTTDTLVLKTYLHICTFLSPMDELNSRFTHQIQKRKWPSQFEWVLPFKNIVLFGYSLPPSITLFTWGEELTIRKDLEAGKDWRQEEKGMTEDEMVGWHHRLDGHEFEQTLGVGNCQGGLVCCSPWGHKELDMIEWLKIRKFQSRKLEIPREHFMQRWAQ